MGDAPVLHIQPITCVEVHSLLVICGMCGHGNVIPYDALDIEKGRVDPASDFDECEECGNGMDCQAATFSAWVKPPATPTGER